MKMKYLLIIVFVAVLGLQNGFAQGQRPTTFPDLPELTDSTLLFTQDSVAQQSYKFTLDKLKGYINTNICLDSTFKNTSNTNVVPSEQHYAPTGLVYLDKISEISGGGDGAVDATSLISNVNNLTLNDGIFEDISMYNSTMLNIFQTLYGNENPNLQLEIIPAEFSVDFPINPQLCSSGNINQIELNAKFNLQLSSLLQETNDPENFIVAMLLEVNGSNMENILEGNLPYTVYIGKVNGEHELKFLANISNNNITSIRGTLYWLSLSSLYANDYQVLLDGFELTYHIDGCETPQVFLTTDANGCIKLDTVACCANTTEINATNGLSLQDESTVKLGGTLTENTEIFTNNKSLFIYSQGNQNAFGNPEGVALFKYSGAPDGCKKRNGDASLVSGRYIISNEIVLDTCLNNIGGLWGFADVFGNRKKYITTSYNINNNVSRLAIVNNEEQGGNNDDSWINFFDENDKTMLRMYKSPIYNGDFMDINGHFNILNDGHILTNTPNLVFNSLNTDNTATQILGKDANGYSVWVDKNALGGGGSSSISTINGISGDGSSGNPVKLGGELTENTNINQNKNALMVTNLNADNSSGSSLVSQIEGSNWQTLIGAMYNNEDIAINIAQVDTLSGTVEAGSAIFNNSDGSIFMTVQKSQNWYRRAFIGYYKENEDWLSLELTKEQGFTIIPQSYFNNINHTYKGQNVFSIRDTTGQRIFNTKSDGHLITSTEKLQFNNLNTDNTATQVLGKDANGYSVWVDKNSLGGGTATNIYNSDGSLTEPRLFNLNGNNFMIQNTESVVSQTSGTFGSNALQMTFTAMGNIGSNTNMTIQGLGIGTGGRGILLEGSGNGKDIEIKVNNGKLIFNGLNTDNTATQVLGKDANGYSVWVDKNSLGGGAATNIYNSDGSLTNNRTITQNDKSLVMNSSSSTFTSLFNKTYNGINLNTKNGNNEYFVNLSSVVGGEGTQIGYKNGTTLNALTFGTLPVVLQNTNSTNSIQLYLSHLGRGYIGKSFGGSPIAANNFAINAPTSIGTTNDARSELDIVGSGAIIIPVGTTTQRPITPVQGMERFNSSFNGKEIYDGTNWIVLSGTWASANRPIGIGVGSTGFNTTLGQKEYYNGTTWVQY